MLVSGLWKRSTLITSLIAFNGVQAIFLKIFPLLCNATNERRFFGLKNEMLKIQFRFVWEQTQR